LTAAITAAPRKADELLAYIKGDLDAYTMGGQEQDDVTLQVMTKD
jgi:hypothetical protein